MTANSVKAEGAGCQQIQVGIVLDRQDTRHPWQNYIWRATALLVPAPAPAPAPWQLLYQAAGHRRYLAAVLSLELHRSETSAYIENLQSRQPVVFIVLRADQVPGRELAPLFVTASPEEAQAYTGNGDDVVEALPMPPSLETWLRAFVDRHHVEKPFIKRQRTPKLDHRVPARTGGRR